MSTKDSTAILRRQRLDQLYITRDAMIRCIYTYLKTNDVETDMASLFRLVADRIASDPA